MQRMQDAVLSAWMKEDMHMHYITAYNHLLDHDIPNIVECYGKFTTMIQEKRYRMWINEVTYVRPTANVQAHIDAGENYLVPISGCMHVEREDAEDEWVHLRDERLVLCHVPMITSTDSYEYCGAFVCRGKLRTIPMTKTVVSNIPVYHRKEGLVQCQVRSMHYDKVYRSTSTLTIVANPSLSSIIVKIPFQVTPVPLATILKALGAESLQSFYESVQAQAGDAYDVYQFRPFYHSLHMHDGTQQECILRLSKLANKSLASTGQNILFNEVLPHLRSDDERPDHCPATNRSKLDELVRIVCDLILLCGGAPTTDRDAYTHAAVHTSVDHLGTLFRLLFIQHTRTFGKLFRRTILSHGHVDAGLARIYGESRLSSRIISSVSSGIWSKIRRGVSISMNSNNPDSVMAQLRRISSSLASTDGAHTKPRAVQVDQYGFICAAFTPDGETTGLVYEMCFTATISPPQPMESLVAACAAVRTLLEPLRGTRVSWVDPMGRSPFRLRDLGEAVSMLRAARRQGRLPRWTVLWHQGRTLRILLGGGLLMRPLLVYPLHDGVGADPGPGQGKGADEHIEAYLEQGAVEFISTMEQSTLCQIAFDQRSATASTTHVEISQASFLGIMAATVPFATGQQGPRLAYFTGQRRQVMTSHPKRYSGAPMTTHLWSTHRPLVETKVGRLLDEDRRFFRGTPVVLAFMSLQDNQEDAMVMKRSTLERGAFMASTTRTYISESSLPSTTYHEKFVRPTPTTSTESYDHLEPNGLPSLSTVIRGSSTVIGKLRMVRTAQSNEVKGTRVDVQWKNISTTTKHDEGGIVTHSELQTKSNGTRVRVDVQTGRPTIVGDKFTSVYAQKGVVGAIWDDVDLPFSAATGIIPDIVVSPLSLTSRMTMSSLVEALTGKAVCIEGDRSLGVDAQDYLGGNRPHVRTIERVLTRHGFRSDGTETFVDGRTGRPIPTRIFTGCVDMYRLVHLASKKIHARSTGPMDPMTRQPKDGRKFGGGLRIGEMESSALVAHGSASVLQERFREFSDAFEVPVCRRCGVFVDHASLEIDYAYCSRCCDGAHVVCIKVPFTFHIMLLELLSAGVSVRMGIEADDVAHDDH